ncbi:sulfate-transporting ATPase [Halovivax asiaticus JCM 14624]|uniref:Sulfate-transporting ATPase n=1 Tax=Halovivax asiaticus JCM 14624 TaxID=1227490 RepID=M0BRC5_9EURY|nr:ABC transporter ATP-binding protein [Halovivax asiaticus]ELZ12249.1 sulfate-transporting ATPase [Halovivax asiaticus JCM 14624]
MAAIQLSGVTKTYGDVAALRGIDLTVERGEVFGFLGPNGAGKSTTIDILLRYTHPTDGRVEVLGHDVATDPVAVRRETGVLPEGFAPFETMTGRQHVEYAIEANAADDDPDELLERVDVAHAADRLATGYSKGMAQRLTLATALVGEPDLLILDEPSTGLDPHGVRTMREIVREECDRGATVFFSSHILEQVEAVADRVGILSDGQLLTVDTIDGLRDGVGATGELTVTLEPDAAGPTESTGSPGGTATATAPGSRSEAAGSSTRGSDQRAPANPSQRSVADPVAVVEAIDGVEAVRRHGDELIVTCRREAKLGVLDELRDAGLAIHDFTTEETSLEDLFVSYTEGER